MWLVLIGILAVIMICCLWRCLFVPISPRLVLLLGILFALGYYILPSQGPETAAPAQHAAIKPPALRASSAGSSDAGNRSAPGYRPIASRPDREPTRPSAPAN